MEDPKVVPQSRKRPLEQNTADIQNSPYYKMRAVLRDLKPHFIEVLKTPDFRNCKAADDIRQGMKLLMDHYKEMMAEPIKLEKCSNNAPLYSSNNVLNGQKPTESYPQGGAPTELLHHGVHGTYIIGGSAVGWNFITYPGGKAVYYGRTKLAFRAANPRSSE
ncbi:hypothetical protein BUALT_Bualt19G0010400 [Buddleja alternifolia]|uniref:Uncharacterized protein n=1 Tax=Buddleja alternifolia TaxID=168488 RepID=A0AAV6W8E8_9LAMI|nr:hypothetical protein BUALT_Bualt19G0010400 [Buddleja alternifolia]